MYSPIELVRYAPHNLSVFPLVLGIVRDHQLVVGIVLAHQLVLGIVRDHQVVVGIVLVCQLVAIGVYYISISYKSILFFVSKYQS